MTDEERLHMITEQLLLVRDNLFRGMSKSIQKLQARSINEVLELENFTRSPQRQWVGLTYEDMVKLQKDLYDAKGESVLPTTFAMAVEAKLKEKNHASPKD
jgi:phage protein U